MYAGLGRMPLSTQVCTRIAKFWLRQIRLKFSRTKFLKYIMMRMTIDILFIAKNKLVLCVNICVFQISKERSSMKYRKKSKRNGFSNTTTTILKKHLLADQKFIEKVWYAYAFTMVIFRRIMTLWESCWIQLRIVLYIYCIGSRRIRLNNCLWCKHVVERYYQHLVNKQFGQRRPFDLRLDTLSRGKKHNTRNTRR